ncbi:hypothetical protein [Mesorhizobium koreense]|jgi:hypothetical protein|uniref:hypothetical protein n=1 Tax=Mesorhizobium koreense TaxID=3074855 RepID=UPI00287BAEDF|nr:hypothetical protein [Mesorhizobium sp. WR6]
MAKTISTFILVTVLTALLMALSIAVMRHGDPFGALGMKRLDGLASAATFIPLAALYFFGVALLMILPLRAASFVLVNGVETVYVAVVVLFATIIGCLVARVAFGQINAYRALLDWQFVFVLAVAVFHAILNELRRNVLMRTLALVASVAATLVCLFWTFRF